MSQDMTGGESAQPHEGNFFLGLCWALAISALIWLAIVDIIVRITRR